MEADHDEAGLEGEDEQAAMGEDGAAEAADGSATDASSLVFPIARVKKIMRIDGDIKKVTVDAVRAVASALEMFLKQAVEGTGAVTLASGNRQIHDGHFRQFTMNHEEFDFLPDCLPPSSRMPKAAASKPRSSTVSAAAHPTAAGGGGRSLGQRAASAAAPSGVGKTGAGKQTVLTFGRQPPAQDRQIDCSSGDEFGQDIAEEAARA